MARIPELSKLTKTELTAMARRKKIPVPSGMLKDAMVKAIKKGLRKIEAQKKSKPATAKTRKRATAQRTKTSPEKAVRGKSRVAVKAKKTPTKKSVANKTKTATAKIRKRTTTAKRKPKTATAKTRKRATTAKQKPKIATAKKVTSKPVPKPRETHPDLPASYGDHRLVVMARDPNWAYAYWELDPKRVHDLTQSAGQSSTRWVLRVYSATLHPEVEKGNYFDIVINVDTGSFYLNLSKPGARFIVEIGVVDASGFFRSAAQSKPVILPLDHPSEAIAPQGDPAHPTAVFPIALK